MRVLAVDQNAVLSADRGLWRELNSFDNCEVIVLAPRRWREHGLDLRCEEETSGMKVISSSTLFTGKSHRAVYLRLNSHVEQFKPDVLYVNAEPESFLAWQAALIKKRRMLTRLVFISWRSIDYPPGVFPYKLPFLNARAERMTLQCADLCIAHNLTAKQILMRKGFNKIVVIPPSVDTSLFFPDRSTRNARPSKAFTIGYVGRLTFEKGVDLLLRASAELGFDYRIVIVGGGPKKLELDQLARTLGIHDRIDWVGSILHHRVPEYLRTMDVLVLPSRTTKYWREQFGRILIEAMACGVSVIGSDSGEIPEVIGDVGLVFKEESVEGLKIGLEKLFTETQLREQLTLNALKRASGFVTGKCARMYLEALGL